jgi:hypothetical protein
MGRSLLGFPVSVSNSQLDITVLDDNTAVPNTAVFNGGLAYTPAGSLYCANVPAGGLAPQGIVYRHGMPVRVDGALIVSASAATKAVNGLPTVSFKEIGVTILVAPTYYHNGIGFNAGSIATNA